ncbi:hypothetical protein D8S78_05950 [Natrialba swarupiae]|nr:hypothetical protein [Natrialba swarupiae]
MFTDDIVGIYPNEFERIYRCSIPSAEPEPRYRFRIGRDVSRVNRRNAPLEYRIRIDSFSEFVRNGRVWFEEHTSNSTVLSVLERTGSVQQVSMAKMNQDGN